MTRKPPQPSPGRRLVLIQAILALAMLVLGGRSVELQVFKSRELSQKAKQDYSRQVDIQGERGEILDRGMNRLAASTRVVSIIACPARIKDKAGTAEKLSGILGLDPKNVQKILSSDRMFAWVAKNVAPEKADRAKALKLPHIAFRDRFRRVYPNLESAAQVIGFTNATGKGLEGLEFKYNDLLSGKRETFSFQKDGNGSVLSTSGDRQPHLKGQSLVLTLDRHIQYLSEQALEQAVTRHRGKTGMALVMRPATGELLAIAHYPRFNPNTFSKFDQTTFRNRAVTDPFEPGSVIKVFTAAAALEYGFSPKEIFFCENGTYKIGRFTVNDTHPHDWLSINQIIKYSSNIGATKIVEIIGPDVLHKKLLAFGFGSRTRVGCPGETPGLLTSARKWSKIDASNISFGQGLSVSAVQLISAVSAVANKGRLMQPLLIKKVMANTGQAVRVNRPRAIRQVLSPHTADQVKWMMNLVVQEEGTGTQAALPQYAVCGKTGTAQKALKKKRGYSKDRFTSVFAGFAPKSRPELAVLVVVDEPRESHYGGEVAAPAFKSIMAQSLNYLNVPPEKQTGLAMAGTPGERSAQ